MTIDLTMIEGYSQMTAEEKIQALETFEMPEVDYTGYVKKDVHENVKAELKKAKKDLNAKLTEDERKAQAEKEAFDTLQEKYEQLLHKTEVSENKAKLLAIGYEEALASDTAEAMVRGEMDKVFENQKKYMETYGKKVLANAMKNVEKPTPDATGTEMTLEKLRAMSPMERLQYAESHEAEYKQLYGGNE